MNRWVRAQQPIAPDPATLRQRGLSGSHSESSPLEIRLLSAVLERFAGADCPRRP